MSQLRLIVCAPDCSCHAVRFEEFTDRYMEDHAKLHKSSWKEDERRIRNKLVPAFGSMNLTDVKRVDVLKLHKNIGRRSPFEANRILELVHGIYEIAIDWEVLPHTHFNPAKRVKTFDEPPREIWVKEDEITGLVEAINSLRSRDVSIVLFLLLFTGLRKNEVMSLKWRDLDFRTKRITVRRENVKTRRTHTLPMTPFVEALLLEMPRRKEHVFPGRKKNPHLTDIEKSWTRVRFESGLQNIIIHDLRRTAASWLANEGVSIQVIQRVLNHSTLAATQIYALLQINTMVEPMTAYEKKIVDMTGLKSGNQAV